MGAMELMGLDMSNPMHVSSLVTIIKYLLLGGLGLVGVLFVFQKLKVHPESEKRNKDLHTLIAHFLKIIYDTYRKKGHKIKEVYPKTEDIHIAEKKIHGVYSWLVKPSKDPEEIKQGKVGTILAERLAVWSHHNRIRVAALTAAWWFNLYFHALQGESIKELKPGMLRLGSIRNKNLEVLQLAGLEHYAKETEKGRVDLVNWLRKREKIDKKHREVMKIEEHELEAIKKLRLEDEQKNGKMLDAHKIAEARADHLKRLIRLAEKQLPLLKKEIAALEKVEEHEQSRKAKKELATLKEDQAELEKGIPRMHSYAALFEQHVRERKGADKKAQEELKSGLVLIENLIFDISSRLRHINQILEQGL
jgi:hypothetical protein